VCIAHMSPSASISPSPSPSISPSPAVGVESTLVFIGAASKSVRPNVLGIEIFKPGSIFKSVKPKLSDRRKRR
jgi:hypothetical protein